MSVPEPADTKSTTMQELKPVQVEVRNVPAIRAGFDTLQAFELMQRQAKLLMSSSLVPKEYQNNLANCTIALEMASRIGASPLMVMQNLDVIYNRPSWRAVFAIACFNTCGRFTSMRYKWGGTPGNDDWSCRAFSTEIATGKEIAGPLITIAIAKAEGWYQKDGSKWKTIPELMLMYRAGSWTVRTHAPEIMMGLQTTEELQDVYDATRGPDGQFRVTTESLRKAAEISAGAQAGQNGGAPAEETGTTSPASMTTPSHEPLKLDSQAEAWANTLRGAKSGKALDNLWKDCVADYSKSGARPPLAVEAARNERRDLLEL